MKVNTVSTFNSSNFTFKHASKMTKYGVSTLIGASSLFMLSNAVDSFNYEDNTNSLSQKIYVAASILGISGTFISLIGLDKDEEDSDKNKYR